MLKKFLSLIVLVCFSVSSFAGVDISQSCQTPNQKPGYCMWASIETICNYLGERNGRGLVEWYVHQPFDNGASFLEAQNQLKILKIKHTANNKYDLEFLKKHLDSGRPAVIAFREGSYLGPHAVVAVDMDEKYVYFVDTNHCGKLFRYDKETFMGEWDGWSLVIDPL